MRLRFVLPVAALSLSMSGCGGSASPAAAHSSADRGSNLAAVARASTSAAPSVSASRSVSKSVKAVASPLVDARGNPIIPAAAKAHTDAGAIAFTKYYWALLDRLDANPQTGVITRLAANGCDVCREEETAYKNNALRRITTEPALSVLTNVRVTKRDNADQTVAVQFDMKHAVSQEWTAGKHSGSNPEVHFSSVALLNWVPSQGWKLLDVGMDRK